MVFLLEEIAVESAAVIATAATAGLLIFVLLGFALEHRARRTSAPAMRLTVHLQPARGAERTAPTVSTLTPSGD